MPFESLMPLPFSHRSFGGRNRVGHFPADLTFDNLFESNVRGAKAGAVNEGTINTSTARIELAHAARDHIDQHVRVADFS